MRVPESWLRQWVPTDASAEQMADALTMAGLEVESLEALAPAFTGVKVAFIESAERHPNADRLQVCQVRVNEGEPSRQIICGAPNARAGLWVACAVDGAVLPGDFRIKIAKMRGVESQGMLCSSKELGLSEESEGIVELNALQSLTLGQDLRDALGLDDKVLEIKLTPNRPDCLSIRGVARELSAILAQPLAPQPEFQQSSLLQEVPKLAEPPRIAIRDEARIAGSALCGRFSSRIIRGVDASQPTPAFIRQRLEQAGQRSISILVDLSNYVMLALGRPTHIFDLDLIEPLQDAQLEVRWAREGEQFELLNGSSPVLGPSFGVIADSKGPVALAGIMGGQRTAVSTATKNILLEAAFWWPDAIRGRSQKLKFSSDAGYRFERGVSAESTVEELELLTALILKYCGGDWGPVNDIQIESPARLPVHLRHHRLERLMGISYATDEVLSVFARLGLRCQSTGEGPETIYQVQPSAERFDLECEEDLVEEVARIVGFDRIPLRAPSALLQARLAPETSRSIHTLRAQMANLGYHEAVTYGFTDSKLAQWFVSNPNSLLKLLNPIASQFDVMRPSIVAGLLRVANENQARQEQRIRLFEIGRVFSRQPDPGIVADAMSVPGVWQPQRLAAFASGLAFPLQWGLESRAVDFFDLKGDLQQLGLLEATGLQQYSSADAADIRVRPLTEHEASESYRFLHPGRSALVIDPSEQVCGWFGELHPSLLNELELQSGSLALELDLELLVKQPWPSVVSPSKFPSMERDLAFILAKAVPLSQVIGAIKDVKNQSKQYDKLVNFMLFDQYVGQGINSDEKSLAFRFLFQDTEKTLEVQEVDDLLGEITKRVVTDCQARLRGAS
jgi:phenylalanyl-tRNA synthetase beta chain